jgi:GT2 family glycosyltransferase
MRIGIGLVTYNNSQEELSRFLKALHLAATEISPQHSIQLIFTDNGAPSKLAQLDSSAEALPSEGNVGYTRAINRLMTHCFEKLNLDAFITGNPDGSFHYLAIKRFIERHQSYPDSLLEARQFPEEHPKTYDPVTLETPWSSGCCLFISKFLYQSVGKFDDHFFMYMEDVDYSWRVRSQGFKARLCPDVLYAHQVIGRKSSETTDRQFLVSGRYLAWKWNNRRFLKWTEKLLRQRQSSNSPLAELPPSKPKLLPNFKTISNFSRAFYFAEPRW